ncbi:efflux RND transporter permease subunit [Vampirovibrio sp.]|uniref:efflux RND transporter permease subunit n=1 Tax=Vampirovibrio sp. TaxID=2717857 RepID=UPI003593AC85
MWISNISIRRPVLASVVSILMILFGLVSLSFLSVREYPDIDPPIISVATVYPGASAEIMESTITERLEDELIGIEGIRSMNSVSREGVSTIIIEFVLERDVNVAAQDVRDRVSRARGVLPDDIEEPIISKQDTDASAILWFSLYGENYSPLQITDYADRFINDQFQTVDGVGSVIIGGEREYAMRLWLSPAKMAARQVSALDVESALRADNVDIPSGRIESTNREFTVRTQGELKTAEQFDRLIVKRVNGIPVYLADIGHAAIGARDDRSLVRFNGQPAVGLGIVKQSKANTLDVARSVKQKMQEISKTLPPGMKMDTAFDSSVFIQRSIDEVVESLFVAFGLVVVVIFFFLRNIRATFIPAISIPISLIATFSIMYFLGYTINTITLLGLTLTIGLVVDDTIVVLENIYRRIEDGENPMEAAFKGTEEIGFAIIATTAVLVAVFLPIIFLGGVLGRILKEFAVVVAGSVMISGFVSLTLTPMLCARLLKIEHTSTGKKQGFNPLAGLLTVFYNFVEVMANGFETTLRQLMRFKWPVFISVSILVVICGALYGLIPREFLPTEDRGSILTFISSPEGSTLGYTDKAVRKAETIYLKTPGVENLFSVIALGSTGPGQVNSGIMFVDLQSREERTLAQDTIVNRVMPQLLSIPEAFVFPISPPSSPIQSFGKPIEMAVQTNGDIHELASVISKIQLRIAQEIPFLINVDTDLKLDKPQLEVGINREKASLLGVSVRDVARTMQIMLGGLNLSTFQYSGKRYDVMVQALPELRATPDQLATIYVNGMNGVMVPLSSVLDYQEAVAPKELNHYNRMRAATISGSLLPIPGVSLGTELEKMKKIAEQEIASGMRVAWKGEAKEFFDANSATFFAFGLAVLVVFMVLAAQFESFSDPLIVILTVPLAVAGAVLTLFMLSYVPMLLKMLPMFADWVPVKYNLNVYSQIGLVLLVGLVTKNGILIVEFANQIREREPQKSPREAVIEASRIRFRPIVMTSVATIFGAIPIAVGLGAGVDGRKPLGAVIVGGMILATFLTLYVVPLMYDLVKSRAFNKAAK